MGTLFPVGWVIVKALLSNAFATTKVSTAYCFKVLTHRALIPGTKITPDFFWAFNSFSTIDITGSGGKQNGKQTASSDCEKTLTPAEFISKYLEKNGREVPSGVLFTFADVAIKSH